MNDLTPLASNFRSEDAKQTIVCPVLAILIRELVDELPDDIETDAEAVSYVKENDPELLDSIQRVADEIKAVKPPPAEVAEAAALKRAIADIRDRLGDFVFYNGEQEAAVLSLYAKCEAALNPPAGLIGGGE